MIVCDYSVKIQSKLPLRASHKELQGWHMCECVFVLVLEFMHYAPTKDIIQPMLSPAAPPPSSVRPWQIPWILAACLRNNTSHQVDRGALRSQVPCSLGCLYPILQLAVSAMIMYSVGIGGGVGIWGETAISAPVGNKGHLFNLWRGGALQLYTVVLLFCMLCSQCIHYTFAVGYICYLPVSIMLME